MREWRPTPSGVVEFRDDGAAWASPEVPPSADTARCLTWEGAVRDAASRAQVPASWVLGVMYAESRGVAGRRSGAGAIGLMQVMPFNAEPYGTTPDGLEDPHTNIIVGAQILGEHRRHADDLVACASMYNAGMTAAYKPHPAPDLPWGLREDPPYIDTVLRANNYFSRRGGFGPALNRGLSRTFFFAAALVVGFVVVRDA